MSESPIKFHKIEGAPSLLYLRVPRGGTRDGFVDHGLNAEEAWKLLAELQQILEPCDPINPNDASWSQ